MNTNANLVDQVCNIEYCVEVAKYLGDEIAINRWVLKFKGDCRMELMTGLEGMPHLSEAWRSNVRTTLIRTQQAQSVDEALCKKGRPHMAAADLLFAELVILPKEALWEGQGVGHIVVAEAVSDEDGDRVIADPPVTNTTSDIAP